MHPECSLSLSLHKFKRFYINTGTFCVTLTAPCHDDKWIVFVERNAIGVKVSPVVVIYAIEVVRVKTIFRSLRGSGLSTIHWCGRFTSSHMLR